MKRYIRPEMEKIELDVKDIIQASQLTNGGSQGSFDGDDSGAGWASANVYDIR